MGPVDRAHVQSRGAGGSDEEWNWLYLCRKHHSEQHTIGWPAFYCKYPTVARHLSAHGWRVTTTFNVRRLEREC